jgi:hypothetical protein
MATLYITHHKFPTNPQLFTIALHKVASLGGEDNPNFRPTFPSAEEYWKLFIYTSGKDSLGESLGPYVADVVGSATDVKEFTDNALAEMCDRIDWSQQGEFSPEVDSSAPVIVEQYPLPGQTGVSISSPVVIRVQDLLPGNGVDASTVQMSIDGLEVTPNVSGNKYDYTFSYSPRPIYDS